MELFDFFGEYETLVKKADILFQKIAQEYPSCVRCHIHCCDCCYAPFGLFIIEAAYINFYFNRLERRQRREIFRRMEKTETDILHAKDRLHVFDDDPKMKVFGMGRQRIRCPFLNDKEECDFYEKRPIICRLYGVPLALKEKVYACGSSGFQKGVTYPTVKLDEIYHQLCNLSERLLNWAGSAHPEKCSLMLFVPRALKLPFNNLIKGILE